MTVRIINADVMDGLAQLPDESVHCVVTSPPYWGLRDYGTATWDGGDPACDHVSGMARGDTQRETPGGKGGSFRGGEVQYRGECGKCGAVADHPCTGKRDPVNLRKSPHMERYAKAAGITGERET